MPQQIYDFVAINRMESFTIREKTKKKVDVCGIITSADTEITTLVSNKTGKNMYKVCFVSLQLILEYINLFQRELIIVDDTKTQISLALWGEDAQNFDHSKYIDQIVAIKGAELRGFNGRSLSASFGSIVSYQIDQTHDDEYAKKVI